MLAFTLACALLDTRSRSKTMYICWQRCAFSLPNPLISAFTCFQCNITRITGPTYDMDPSQFAGILALLSPCKLHSTHHQHYTWPCAS